MIIFLYGPDDWRREQRKKFYIEEFKKKYFDLPGSRTSDAGTSRWRASEVSPPGLSIGYFDLAEDGKLDEFDAFLRSESLFQPKKLAVLENLYEADEKKLSAIIKSIVAKKATVLLFSESGKPAGALKFLAEPEKPSVAEKFEHLEGADWITFIKKEAKARGAVLSADAVNFLAEVYAKNSWGLVTELEKSSNLEKTEVSRDDLEAFGLETLPNYWMMVNSAKSQNLKSRLWALENLLSQKEPPAKLFNILASIWREKIPQMAEYDFMVKSGKLEYEEALLELAL